MAASVALCEQALGLGKTVCLGAFGVGESCARTSAGVPSSHHSYRRPRHSHKTWSALRIVEDSLTQKLGGRRSFNSLFGPALDQCCIHISQKKKEPDRRKRGLQCNAKASNGETEPQSETNSKQWWNPLNLLQGNRDATAPRDSSLDLDGEVPDTPKEVSKDGKPEFRPLGTRLGQNAARDGKGAPTPQKRIKDMTVVEKDGRKIVTIGMVEPEQSPTRSRRVSQENTSKSTANEEQPEAIKRKEISEVGERGGQPEVLVAPPTEQNASEQRPGVGEAEGLFARLRATPEELATAQAKYDRLIQDPLVGFELVKSARRYLLSLQRRARPYGWLYAPLAIAPLGVLHPIAQIWALQTIVENFLVGWAAIVAIDVAVVVLLDAVVTLMAKGAPHLWLPGGESPWVKPWLSDGHPAGFKIWVRATLAIGFVLPIVGLGVSYLVGMPQWGLAVFVPYLIVMTLQMVFEQSLLTRKSALWPLVVLLFTLYRMVQIGRAREIVMQIIPLTTDQAPTFLRATVELLAALWTLNTASVIAQLPWYYLRWGQPSDKEAPA